jgi:peptidoglycan-associated lipoprotein
MNSHAMNSHGLRVIAIVALASSPIVVGVWPVLAQARAPAVAGAAIPDAFVLAQAAPAPPPEPIALPPVRDYEAVPELRDVHFDFGKAVIRPDDRSILDANAAWLRAHPEYLVLIEGHSDGRGITTSKNEFNMALGERRAEAAMNDLVARGVQPDRITILSYGEERPVCSEQSERCWTQNRRARFLVKPR